MFWIIISLTFVYYQLQQYFEASYKLKVALRGDRSGNGSLEPTNKGTVPVSLSSIMKVQILRWR